MSNETQHEGSDKPKKRRLGVSGYVRAMIIARTAAVSWPEAKEMARRSDSELGGPTDVVRDSERPGRRNGP